MSHNILNYSGTDANRGRWQDIKLVVGDYQPDFMVIQELNDATGATKILDSALNVNGQTNYARAAFVNGPDTDNMLFYRADKLFLVGQYQISTTLRDITRYDLRSISGTDTIFFSVFSAHLKAGNQPSDETDRLNEINAFCSAISSLPSTSNLIFAGDCNVYSSTEAWYTKFTSTACSVKFYDPINMPGFWNNNGAFSTIHTQSTRTSANSGCCGGSTGGLDDRFDLIHVNYNTLVGTGGMKILSNTYKAYGNDGNHFNAAITDAPANGVVSAAIAQALFNISDHLPVVATFRLHADFTGISESNTENNAVQFAQDRLFVSTSGDGLFNLSVYDISGRLVHTENLNLSSGDQIIPFIKQLESGVYYFSISNSLIKFGTKAVVE